MGKVGTGFGLNFEETNLRDELTFAGGLFASTYTAIAPNNGAVFLSIATNGGDTEASSNVKISLNNVNIMDAAMGKADGDSGRAIGCSVSASLVVKKGDVILMYARNSATKSTVTLNALSTAGKLNFSIKHING